MGPLTGGIPTTGNYPGKARIRYKDSIEQILSESFDFNKVKPCVESKVFGIGVESYMAGSAEFTLSFAAAHADK